MKSAAGSNNFNQDFKNVILRNDSKELTYISYIKEI